DGPGDLGRWDAAPRERPSGGRRRGGHVGVGAQVQVEHRPLRALAEDPPILAQRPLNDRVDVADARPQALGVLEVLVEDRKLVERLVAVEAGQRFVLLPGGEAQRLFWGQPAW